jgi:NADH-quinone oxidoreductase subunit J
MMLNINLESRGTERASLTLVGSSVVLLTLAGLSSFLPNTGYAPESFSTFQGFGWADLFDCLNTLETLGQILYTKAFILFLIAGFILLIALVGSIVLTLQTRHDVKKQSAAFQRSRDADNSIFMVDLDPSVSSAKLPKNLYKMLQNRFNSLLVKKGQSPNKIR